MKLYDITTEAIENKIRELAKEYTPEWEYNGEKPDIGATIAKLFAIQMKENTDMANRVMDRYHTEFVNMLDISQRSAKAAGSMVCFSIIDDTVPGIFVRKGTRLLTDSGTGDGESVYFETDREIYVTGSHIIDAFMTDREDGTIVPLLGNFNPDDIIDGTPVIINESEPLEAEEEAGEGAEAVLEEETPVSEGSLQEVNIKPFVLFAESGSISKSLLIIYHDFIFDIEEEPIFIKITGNEEFIERIEAGDFRFRYYSAEGLKAFDSVKLLEDKKTFMLVKSTENRRFITGSRESSVVVLEKLTNSREEISVKSVSLSSRGGERPLDYVDDGTSELDTDHFAPFSDTLSVYNECYLGHNLYFSKAGALITVTFSVSYPERSLYLTKQQEEESLKIIKRKPKIVPSDIPAEAYADEISLEYFNGTGFKKLKCLDDITRIFSDGQAKTIVFSFICPTDWEEIQSGAFSGRAVRMRLQQSDNCFLRPCIHHYPVISGMKVSFTYEGRYLEPFKLNSYAGTKRRDITNQNRNGKGFAVITGGGYSDDALYLGFDKKLDNGPVSLFIELEDVLHQKGLACIWEYSSPEGFKRLKILDQTASFMKSGAVLFIPPSDLSRMELEKKRRYWIKIRRANVQNESESRLFLPRIRRILLNIVGVTNIVSYPEENYYLSESGPLKRVTLSTGNILDAEVWVNETGNISNDEIERLKIEKPEDIKVDYDILGGVSSVYVKWNEAESFLNAPDRRSYMLDRVTGEIVFSDGINADFPKVIDDVTFRASIKTTNGRLGNVAAGAIQEMADTALYIDQVINPVRAYGGRDMETVEEALYRGAHIIGTRGRLVSAKDYIWEILNFSDSIAKTACLPGMTVEGLADEADISIVLLMRDYVDGSFSFQRIAPSLKDHLLQRSAMTLSPQHLHIMEPVFITVSVKVWVEIAEVEENFEIQNMIVATLTTWLDPVNGNGGEGFEIGSIPKSSQILMKLATLKNHARVTKSSMTAHYVDRDGEHETDLDRLRVTPLMAVRPGKHTVHIIVKE
ncbi:MAG: hypothetical protein K5770_17180 [Lachnospiraceae bacterium]|nr:hypothetical protein [Lachnospiraceae bacterium]